jgi:hypothetical protein
MVIFRRSLENSGGGGGGGIRSSNPRFEAEIACEIIHLKKNFENTCKNAKYVSDTQFGAKFSERCKNLVKMSEIALTSRSMLISLDLLFYKAFSC